MSICQLPGIRFFAPRIPRCPRYRGVHFLQPLKQFGMLQLNEVTDLPNNRNTPAVTDTATEAMEF